MEDHAGLNAARRPGAGPLRDGLAFAGLAPLVALTVLGFVLVVAGLAGYARTWMGPSAWALLPIAVPAAIGGLLGLGSLLRCWWWLLDTAQPLPAARRYRLWPVLLTGALAIFALAPHLGADEPPLAAWTVLGASGSIAAAALLLAATARAPRSAPRTRRALAAQAVAVVASWAVVASVVPALRAASGAPSPGPEMKKAASAP